MRTSANDGMAGELGFESGLTEVRVSCSDLPNNGRINLRGFDACSAVVMLLGDARIDMTEYGGGEMRSTASEHGGGIAPGNVEIGGAALLALSR
jgi:hypothetical protein